MLCFLCYLLFNMSAFRMGLQKGFQKRHDAIVSVFDDVMARVFEAMDFGMRQML